MKLYAIIATLLLGTATIQASEKRKPTGPEDVSAKRLRLQNQAPYASDSSEIGYASDYSEEDGRLVTKTYSLRSLPLTGIDVSGAASCIGSVEIIGGKKGDRNEVTVTADKNVIDKIAVTLAESDLCLKPKANCFIDPREPIFYRIHLSPYTRRQLTSLKTSLPLRVKVSLNVETLMLSVHGSAELRAEKNIKVADSFFVEQLNESAISLKNVIAQKFFLAKYSPQPFMMTAGKVDCVTMTKPGVETIRKKNLKLEPISLDCPKNHLSQQAALQATCIQLIEKLKQEDRENAVDFLL
jgi:hypothetical protein